MLVIIMDPSMFWTRIVLKSQIHMDDPLEFSPDLNEPVILFIKLPSYCLTRCKRKTCNYHTWSSILPCYVSTIRTSFIPDILFLLTEFLFPVFIILIFSNLDHKIAWFVCEVKGFWQQIDWCITWADLIYTKRIVLG